jgi:hypothetical protein
VPERINDVCFWKQSGICLLQAFPLTSDLECRDRAIEATGLLRREVALIEVRRISEGSPLDFEVVVREGEGETRHHVTMSRAMCERLTAGRHTPEHCLEAVFRFLLDREPKESILRRFDVTAISRYFPEFDREMPRYLTASPFH